MRSETVNIAGYQMRFFETKLERLILDAPDKQTHLITSNVNRR